MKNISSTTTELNDIKIYVGLLYCNPILFNSVMTQVTEWPKNSFEFNIAFFSYITYLMYDQLSKTSNTSNSSKLQTVQNKIKMYKITTPFRMNTPFIYRVDITTFLPYLTTSSIKTKLTNYKNLTSTLSIDLPTALLISYYDKNPQSTTDQNTELSSQAILNSYYANQSILSGSTVPTIGTSVNVPIANVIERFDNINIVQELNNKINNQYIKYALI
jgi:hypothetical protein